MITYFEIIFLATGSLLLIWKRRQAKKLLVLALVGGTGFTVFRQQQPLNYNYPQRKQKH
ncbi:MAG: hypothetical protein ACLTW7_16030 [Enterococcus sp.]|uniref:hypothetical protein n=1 Tax=Enterococcus sp. TaxID=35783 RepID=UPI0039967537